MPPSCGTTLHKTQQHHLEILLKLECSRMRHDQFTYMPDLVVITATITRHYQYSTVVESRNQNISFLVWTPGTPAPRSWSAHPSCVQSHSSINGQIKHIQIRSLNPEKHLLRILISCCYNKFPISSCSITIQFQFLQGHWFLPGLSLLMDWWTGRAPFLNDHMVNASYSGTWSHTAKCCILKICTQAITNSAYHWLLMCMKVLHDAKLLMSWVETSLL